MTGPGLDIVLDAVTKEFGGHRALEEVSFTARAGRVTGFVGRNGAGKTTAMRILLGLAAPGSGTATIGGLPHRQLPPGTVGHLLDSAFHPGRTGRAHLEIQAAALGLDRSGIDDVLRDVGLLEAAGRRTRGYSLGMRQRLGLARALLGSPKVLVLDEPTNGLDPDGILWLRERLRRAADDGATVLVSSHLLGELEQLVDDVVFLQGRVVWQGTHGDAAEESTDGSLEQLYRQLVGTGAAA
ncbi:ABC transporter ATP-binding protein [Kitasatospora sp. NPDC051170]|uniref:ABC transporter ATP-binding protein n=1 Tax=Kitasatospora sp. NPDC051170 TaxID=3364056 RepID=UPI00378C25E0